MTSGRRLVILLTVVALIGAPAVVLRLFCVGNACPSASSASTASVPFCPLPADLRTLVEDGFYANQGRSPDVFSIAKQANVAGGTGTEPTGAAPVWPALPQETGSGVPTTQVPMIFSGQGVSKKAKIPAGTGLDDIAPTIANAIGVPREHPELRAGKPIPGLVSGPKPKLVLEIIWAGTGSGDFTSPVGKAGTAGTAGAGGATSSLGGPANSLFKNGAGTMEATTGSLPVDSTAALTTIGTGGLPFQHGIPGSVVRDRNGNLVVTWSKNAPISVLPTVGDDLMHDTGGRAHLGLVAPSALDRGIVGGDWYEALPGETKTDQADISVVPRSKQVAAVQKMLASGFGTDDIPDILAVVLQSNGDLKTQVETQELIRYANAAAGGSVLTIVAGTGQAGPPASATSTISGAEVVRQVDQALGAPVVSQAVPGGLFLDQAVLASKGITAGKVVAALAAVHAPPAPSAASTSPAGPAPPLMDQAFPAFSITFARYC